MNKMCIHCYVSGLVQGVFYRASAKQEAERLDLTGWVRNLPDGRVEVFACGQTEKIKEFYAWLKHGPDLARVDEVSYEELGWEEYDEFSIIK